ncbi:MAG: hypothetical protein ACE5E5_03985 [Phycisphaerae bacterium]
MPHDDSAAVLKQKLKRLLSQDLSEMGYEAKARHRRRVAEVTRAYDRARAQAEEHAESKDPVATSGP